MNPSLYNEWVAFKDRLAESFTSTWIPKQEQRPMEIGDIPYNDLDYKEVRRQFDKLIPSLEDRLKKLEYKLQQLWDDINSAEIEKTIKETHCDEC